MCAKSYVVKALVDQRAVVSFPTGEQDRAWAVFGRWIEHARRVRWDCLVWVEQDGVVLVAEAVVCGGSVGVSAGEVEGLVKRSRGGRGVRRVGV